MNFNQLKEHFEYEGYQVEIGSAETIYVSRRNTLGKYLLLSIQVGGEIKTQTDYFRNLTNAKKEEYLDVVYAYALSIIREEMRVDYFRLRFDALSRQNSYLGYKPHIDEFVITSLTEECADLKMRFTEAEMVDIPSDLINIVERESIRYD